jgi:hypothetical protein
MRLVASVVPSAVHQMSNPGHVGARLVYLHFRDANPSARAHVDVGLGLAGRPFGGANSTPGPAYGRVVSRDLARAGDRRVLSFRALRESLPGRPTCPARQRMQPYQSACRLVTQMERMAPPSTGIMAPVM